MFNDILACLDGSSLAEKILPLARAVAGATGGKLTLLRVVEDAAEFAAEEGYLRDCARQYAAELSFVVDGDAASAIAADLAKHPNAIAALTTHGRSAWSEAILGSVALRVLREAKRPLLLYCPIHEDANAPKIIDTVVAPLDGSDLSERIIPYAVKAAESLSARLILVQALPLPSPLAELSSQEQADVSEAAYLHGKTAEIKKLYGITPQWEVLHGNAADAICLYVTMMPNTLLAMTTHARGGLDRAILGSVAATCLRHAGVPLLLYWPHDR